MRQWRREASPLIAALCSAQQELMIAVGDPGVTVLAACDQLDRAIADAELWMISNPCPDGQVAESVSDLVAACSGMWAMMTAIARRAPAGIDAGAQVLPRTFSGYMVERVTALAHARDDIRRFGFR